MKTLPAAKDIEKAVLGAILLESDALNIVRDKLSPDAFYDSKHRKTYQAILDLDENNGLIDMFTVQEKLKENDPTYLTDLMSQVATAQHIEYHSLILLQKYAQRKLAFIGQKIKEKAFDDSVDVNETISFAEQSIEQTIRVMNKGISTPDFRDILNKSLEEYYEREELAKRNKVSGISTPIADLTEMTNGWQNSDLIIIAGRPSMGKTALALQSMEKASQEGYNSVIFSLEMGAVRLVDRILCGNADVSMEKFRSGHLSEVEKERMKDAAADLENRGIAIDDNGSASIDYIRSKAMLKHKEEKCDLVIIDYGQLIDTSYLKAGTREQEVAITSRKAKQLAKDLNIPVIFISQLNRGVEQREDKRPRLSDLRESGGIEQDADVVIMVYRAAKYGEEETEYGDAKDPHRIGEIIIAKQRNGKIGKLMFRHNEALTRIYDYDREGYEDMPF